MNSSLSLAGSHDYMLLRNLQSCNKISLCIFIFLASIVFVKVMLHTACKPLSDDCQNGPL
uniref:Uncharacterized protein n=1 Tax=Arundo donax TaxID=35708 RepID=A0A0A9GT65_ARUDO